MSKEMKPIERVRHSIIREFEKDPYMIMQAMYSLAPTYYDRQYHKYNT